MARTLEEIRASIVARKEGDPVLSAQLTSDSDVAEWSLWVDVVAFCIFVLEELWDGFKAVVQAMLDGQKAHTLRWYVLKARAFQYGYALEGDSDVYSEIYPPAQIVTQASAVENAPFIDIKAVKGSAGAYVPLDSDELAAFRAYMNWVKDAGVRLRISSSVADDLRLIYTIYYDPLVLDSAGRRLDGTNDHPVRDAIVAFIAQVPFNNVLVLRRLDAYIEANVQGVVIAQRTYAASRYGELAYVEREVEVAPNGGHLLLDSAHFDDEVTYLAHSPIV